MTPYLYDFIEAKIVHQTSPIEAYRKFDTISSKHTELLRKYTKQVQEARANNEEETIKKHINDYEVILSQLIIKKSFSIFIVDKIIIKYLGTFHNYLIYDNVYPFTISISV